MKIVWTIIGVLLFLMGALWTLQGINILRGAFMSGRILYAVLGLILVAAGIIMVVFNNRRQKPAAGGEDPGENR